MNNLNIESNLKIKIYDELNNQQVEKEHNNLFINDIKFKNVDFFVESKLHMFTFAVIPYCLTNRILDCCNIITLFFIIDDLYEENNQPHSTISDFINILNNNKNDKNSDNKYLILFYKIWVNIKSNSNIISLKQFSNSIKDWFSTLKIKTTDFNRYSYLPFRRVNSGFFFVLSVLRYGMNINLDDNILNSDYIKNIQEIVGDHAMLVNDIYSYKKECIKNINKSYQSNMISILENTENLDTNSSIKEIIDVVLEKEKQFKELINKNPYENKEVNKYIDSLEYVMSGNYYWSTITNRYNC